jgi:exopolyphosphatase/guanosine-5'-triphosphate,3'-diphosphate pyrophosphatase
VRVHLVRRAKAGRRSGGRAEDVGRPLNDDGEAQARGLAESMDGERIDRVVTSPARRCVQTVEPLARRRGIEVEVDERLGEYANAKRTVELLRSFGDGAVVACTHSDVIQKLFDRFGRSLKTKGKKFRRRKGSAWLLEGDLDGKLTATYHPLASDLDEEPLRIAVLDMGSTSFHLVVGDVGSDGSIERVTRERDMLRLGALVDEDARIPLEDCDRVIESVLHLADAAEDANAEVLIAFATAAFREAKNGPVLARLLGHARRSDVRILSGEEEARTIFSAFRRRVDLGPNPELGLDLGGGSLEFAIGNAHDVSWEATTPLGAVRLHAQFSNDEVELSERDAKKMQAYIRKTLAPILEPIRLHEPQRCIATGGTVRAIARVLLAIDPDEVDTALFGTELAASDIGDLAQRLRELSHEERISLPGMNPRRADILPAGALVLATTLEELGIPELMVCDWGLREGIMLDAVRDSNGRQ